MTYISRRLSVTNERGEQTEYSDAAFLALNAPLIILGEPGAGKSALVKHIEDTLGVQFYNASTIESLASIDARPSQRIIVDGVDEITAYDTGTPINRFLVKLPQHASFILTCRAADWQDVVNTRIIQQKWQKRPVAGRLLPLNHYEIVEFINASDTGQDGETFLEEAHRRDVVNLLGNPQNLTMLLKAVQSSGWPDTRLQLYETASLALVQEDNDTHSSIHRTRPSPEKLIEAAGFISAQLLLSGTAYIRVDGNGSTALPRATDLAGTELDASVIHSALSTKIFRVAGDNILEPCHRTVAEFLAARWLSGALRDRLSLRRLESLLYGNGYIVPTALRGLHAWIATLHPNLANTFITRDSYGFFRYGDPTALTVSQSRHLLGCLEKVAEDDPYFRSEDWHVTFGRGLARPELRDDIRRVIRNPSLSYQLSHLLIESMQGDRFVNDIADDLQTLLLDPTVTFAVRHAAVDALLAGETQIDWHPIITQLMQAADIESLRIALEIVGKNIPAFDGAAIARLLLNIAEATHAEDGSTYSGLGHALHRHMSPEQLESCLDILSQHQAEQTGNARRRLGNPEQWIFKFMQERLGRGTPPSTRTIYAWLQNTDRHSYYRSDWDTFAAGYFSQLVTLRQAIQAEALTHAADEHGYWKILFHFNYDYPALGLHEEDIIFHMNALVTARSHYADWPVRWRHLVDFAIGRRNFTGSAMEHATNQSGQHPALQAQLDQLNHPPHQNFEQEEREWERKNRQTRQRKIQARHQNFERIRDTLGAGQHLGALGDVAAAYLGHSISPREGDTPIDRVTELVGSSLVDTALEGLTAAMQRDDIPTARQIIELHANERKSYYFEPILLAHCARMLQSGQDVSGLPPAVAHAALAAYHWGNSYGDEMVAVVKKRLEAIVFESQDSKESFIRDTIEPHLHAGTDHIPGLSLLAREEALSDVAGKLAIEWLDHYPHLSGHSLQDLLVAAIRYAPGDAILALIRQRITHAQWDCDAQRHLWMGAAFLLDYAHHADILAAYASEEKERLWAFRTMIYPERESNEDWPELDPSQHHFLITRFGPIWPPADMPSGGSIGDQNPWDASRFIQTHIDALATQLSDTAENFLSSLIGAAGLDGYQAYIKHVYAQQTRQRAEANKTLPSLDGVRKVLLKGEPATHDDLQALLMDELEALQNRIRNSPTNDILPFWNGDDPHEENYCRDRLTSTLTPHLDRFGIRAHIESAMPDQNRCDLLATHGRMDLPIEIKGQWHPKIWTAAAEQLEDNYTQEYRAEGRGIYLVLWFGYLGTKHPKNPRGWQGQRLPKTLDQMKTLLTRKYEGISEKTTLFVLDLSKPC